MPRPANVDRENELAHFEAMLKQLPKDAQPMHAIRTLVSAMGLIDQKPNANDLPSIREKAVKLLDERGVSCEPVAKGTRPRRWWGHFRGEGRFKLVVDGVLQDIPEIVIEKEK